MAYIPDNHKKYNLLPRTRERDDRECFSYPVKMVDAIGFVLSADLTPYGYSSLEEYITVIEDLKIGREHDPDMISLLDELVENLKQMNDKAAWSVLKYTGPNDDDGLGLTSGRDYYWPCSFENPVYEGVVDDEEFTSYYYPANPDYWIILEDPTGMAERTLKQYVKNSGNED